MRKLQINSISLIAILLVVIGEIGSFIVQELPLELRYKIIISLFYLVASYIYMIRHFIKNKNFFNPLFLIIVLSIFFYFGQHLLAAFNPEYLYFHQVNHVLDTKLSDDSVIRATFLAMESLLLVFSGYHIIRADDNQISITKIDNYNSKIQALKITAWIVLFISIFPMIRLQLALYRLNTIYGYLGRRTLESDANYYQILGISPIISTIAKFFLISVYALLIAYKGKKYRYLIYFFVIGYCILYYFTGSRFEIVKLLVTVFLIETIWIRHPTKKDILKYIVIGFAVILSFSAGTIIRSVGLGFSDAIGDVSIGNTLWESGITFTSISNVIDKCPSVVDYFYGKSIVGAILQCLPPFLRFGFFDKYTLATSITFAPLYYLTKNHGYGSSFVAEAYYNFGFLLYPFMFVYGLILRWITHALSSSQESQSPYVFLVLAVTCGSLVYGVRNDLSSIPREILYTTGVFIVIVIMIEQIVKKQK